MNKYKIITLCGSTKFKEDFQKIYEKLSMDGNIVLTVCCFTHADNLSIDSKDLDMFHDMHFQKILMSDAIFVINKNGYIGEQTKLEIEYAKKNNKEILYLE